MTEIKKIAVLGSGVMGSGIACQLANAGMKVLLLDLEKPDAAIEKQLKSKTPGLAHKRFAKNITTGTFDKNMKDIAECDWIIEVVIEKLDIKRDVYKKIDAVRKPGSIVSSNTSTLPIKELIEGASDAFKKDFMITHFFNPPRFMRLLEVVKGEHTRADAYDTICQFADVTAGKTIVECKDTPGFIANRIGVYWLMLGLLEAIKLGVSVEEADAVMSRPVGIPKTGVFGLFDLIGIDLMPLIAQEMLHSLPKEDAFVKVYAEPELVKNMIADGYTGRKGKGGFYRINKEDGGKVKEVKNLKTGEYAKAGKAQLASVDAAKSGLRYLLEHDDIGGQYARAVMIPLLHYAASLMPEIADDIDSIDQAMKLGYAWKYGPFELIDRLSTKDENGVDWLCAQFEKAGLTIPPVLTKAKGSTLYKTDGGKYLGFTIGGKHEAIIPPDGSLMLSDIKLTAKPILKNASASLWDIGDGVACVEFTSKMNSVDPDILDMLNKSVEKVKTDFKGLVIGNDADNFCVGANLGFLLMAANLAAWGQISDIIQGGQNTMMGLKYAPFPVVGALSGMALGGGCEIMLHCDAVQGHMESYPGLVEVGVGLIPGWGGCKEMILRNLGEKDSKESSGFIGNMMAAGGAMPAIKTAFETIALAKVGMSAEEGRDMKVLREGDRITMNRRRVLADAKARCLELAASYSAPEPATVKLPGGTAKVALNMALDGFKAAGKATAHDVTVCKGLAIVLSGGDTDISDTLTEQNLLDLEHQVFMDLIKQKPSLDRIEHMLNTGKPLRN